MPRGGLSTFFFKTCPVDSSLVGEIYEAWNTRGFSFKIREEELFPGCMVAPCIGKRWSEVNVGDPMDLIVHGLLQARILQWVAFPFSRDLPNPGIKPRSPTLQEDSLPAEQGKPKNTGVGSLSLFRRSSRPRNRTRISCIAGGFFNNWAFRKEVEVKVKMGDSNIP